MRVERLWKTGRRLLGSGVLAIAGVPHLVDAWPSPRQGFELCSPVYALGGIQEIARTDEEVAELRNGWAYLDESTANRVALRTSLDSGGYFARMIYSMASSYEKPYSAEIGWRLGFDRQWSPENDLPCAIREPRWSSKALVTTAANT